MNQPFRMRFPGKHFSTFCSPNRVLTLLKSASLGKHIRKGWLCLPKSSFGMGTIIWAYSCPKDDTNGPFCYLFRWFSFPEHCVCCHRLLLSPFSYHIRPKPESATFLARHNVIDSKGPLNRPFYALSFPKNFFYCHRWFLSTLRFGRSAPNPKAALSLGR
jgi:hypothetical protein